MMGGREDVDQSIKVELVNASAVGVDHSTVNRTIYHMDFGDCIPFTSRIFDNHGHCGIWPGSH